VVTEFPGRERALVLLGNALECQGQDAEAVECWNKALQMDAKRADVHKSLGQSAMLKGDYEAAVSHWQKALEIDPGMGSIRGALALALMGLGRHKEAVEELEYGRRAGILSTSDHFLLGQGYLQLGRLHEAKASYETAVKLQSDLTNAYYGLFTVCTRLNEPEKARQYMATFQKLKADEMKVLKDRNDTFSDLQNVRGQIALTFLEAGLLYQEQRNPEKAERMLRRGAEIDPQNVAVLNELGLFYQAVGRVAEALEVFQRAAAVKPPNPVSCLNVGILLARLDRVGEAEEAFRTVIRVAPGRSEGYRELAQLFLKAQIKLLEAKRLAEKAVALEPVARNYFTLSRACDRNGDSARALSALKRATDLEPSNEQYRRTYDRLRAREAKR